MSTFELIVLLVMFVWIVLLQLQNRARTVEIRSF